MFQTLSLPQVPSIAVSPATESRAWFGAALIGLIAGAAVVLHALATAFPA